MPIRQTTIEEYGKLTVHMEGSQTLIEAIQEFEALRNPENDTYLVVSLSDGNYNVILFSDLFSDLEENINKLGTGYLNQPLSSLPISPASRIVPTDTEESGGDIIDWIAYNPQAPIVVTDAGKFAALFINLNMSGESRPTDNRSFHEVIREATIEVPIFFATDRQRITTPSVQISYGGERNDGVLEYGVVKVSIPKVHRMGEIEQPQWWRLEFWQDPKKHFVLLGVKAFEQSSFIDILCNSVRASETPDLLIFIHGYNTSFNAAALRAAQIAYDLNFPGPVILYSWPSKARVESYTVDENNIDWTTPHFQEFLNLLLSSTGANTVNIIAHSMGNRILVKAIDNLAPLTKGTATLNNVIFAAPDIDAAVFKQFVEKLKEKANRLTLYASSNDKALKASKVVHGYPRAGDSEDIVIVNGLDSIDATLIDTSFMGHSYFGDNRSIISDIFYLIRQNLSPSERVGLKQKAIQDLYYWLFQP